MSAALPDDPVPDDAAPPASPKGVERADWLVGPDEGLAAEMERARSSEGVDRPRPTLLRPGAAAETPSAAVPTPLHRPAPPAAAPPAAAPRPGAVTPGIGDGFERGPGSMVWEPGARSVPSLRRGDNAREVPESTHDFPMDDAEDRAHSSAIGGTLAESYEPPPHEVIAPEAFDLSAAAVPWWMQAMHTLRADRRIQLMVGGVIVVLSIIALWPRGERPMSVANLRRHAAGMDGVDVKVAGTVGEVFKVGGGYAFYLRDGRDTLVVFTRVRHPEPRQHVTIQGTMSTGFLDGQSTLALFESNEK